MKLFQLKLIFILISLPGQNNASFFDPYGFGTAFGSVVYSYFDRFMKIGPIKHSYEAVRTIFGETCDEKWITPDMTGLHNELNEKLHGQHIVVNLVLSKMRLYFRRQTSLKALALSFHGWTGSGKNFVSQIIVNNIFKLKGKSSFVHWFIGSVHFPHKSQVERYKDNLIGWIRGNVSNCDRSVFIFDEVDKMPIGLLDTVKPFIDNYENIDNIDYRRSIFIFLSNTGGSAITEKMLQHWTQGKDRNSVKINDFHELIEQGAFNEMLNDQGGLYRSSMIDKHLIDYYVPFLPLERQHVKLCARDAFRAAGLNPSNEELDAIADKMPFYPDDRKIFSRVGCKRIENKVNEYLYYDEEEDQQ